jgi:acetoin utilization protein AcuB
LIKAPDLNIKNKKMENNNPKTLVKDVMSSENMITVNLEDSIGKVAEVMSQNRVHGIPVIDNKRVVGIVTETDFFTKSFPDLYLPSYIDLLLKAKPGLGGQGNAEQFERLLNEKKAKDIMTAPCMTVSTDTELEKIIDLIRVRQFYTLPVINENQELVGIITLTDVIRLFE